LCSQFENIDRINSRNFKPTDLDILACKCKTTGILEGEFQSQGVNFKLVDTGGQRNERKK